MASLRRRFGFLFDSPESCAPYLLPVVLDPRTKALKYIPEGNREGLLRLARQSVRNLEPAVEPSGEVGGSTSFLDKLFFSASESEPSDVFDRYLVATVERNCDPGLWYAGRPEFASLFQLYRIHNCAPAAAVDVERMWNDGGALDEPLRSRMKPENLSNRLFYKMNKGKE